MQCPRCGRAGKKIFKGYCSEVHHRLAEDRRGKLVRLFCAVCERPIFRVPSKIPKKGKAVCARCSKNQGENHGNFKGARYHDPKGYVHILVGDRYVLEHRYHWERFNRSCFIQWMDPAIHHINFIKNDNRPQNLLLVSYKEHSRIHKFINLGRQAEAYEIMHKRALEQYFYPSEVDQYRPTVNQEE